MLVTDRGYIHWAWAHEGYEGPQLGGRHIAEFLQPAEVGKIMAWMREALRSRLPVTGHIKLGVDAGIRFETRKVRLLPWTKNVILGYVVKNAP